MRPQVPPAAANQAPRITLQLRELEGCSIEGLDPVVLRRQVGLQQAVLLQQVLHLQKVLPELLRCQLGLPG